MTETKRAWMAGFVDGEGCLTVSCFMRGHRHRGHAHQYHPVVTVANTQRKALEVFQEAYGGEIEFVVARQKNRQDSWHWRCPAKMVPILLEHLLPYLLLKRPQAELLLELCRLKNARVMVGRHLSPEDVQKRRECYLRIKEQQGKKLTAGVTGALLAGTG